MEGNPLDAINTIAYCVATVFTNKEGEELSATNQVRTPKKGRLNPTPPWKQRLEQTVARLRKEVDILCDFRSGKLKRNKCIKYAESVMRKHKISGSRSEIDKLIFTLKNKISVSSLRLRRYNTQERSRKQNETFMSNRK